jgi:hypothetical protein
MTGGEAYKQKLLTDDALDAAISAYLAGLEGGSSDGCQQHRRLDRVPLLRPGHALPPQHLDGDQAMTGGEAYKQKLLTDDALDAAISAYLADPSKLIHSGVTSWISTESVTRIPQ